MGNLLAITRERDEEERKKRKEERRKKIKKEGKSLLYLPLQKPRERDITRFPL